MRVKFDRESAESFEERRTRISGAVMRFDLPFERHANKVYTWVMFKQFGNIMYNSNCYEIEDLEKNKLYSATHCQADKREKWSRIVFQIKVIDDGQEFDCECGQFALCTHGDVVLPYAEGGKQIMKINSEVVVLS